MKHTHHPNLSAAVFGALVLTGIGSGLVFGQDTPPVANAEIKGEILTPPVLDQPRINGPSVIGTRMGARFFYVIPATGKPPVSFLAADLPTGLQLDGTSGTITGVLRKPGEYVMTLRAKNLIGVYDRKLRIVVGDKIALTPPMGWNSWNCWGGSVNSDKVRRAAQAMIRFGLNQHGWSYINVDDTWQGKRGGPFNAIQPNEKFPDMLMLCALIHQDGLKFGIYSTPWVTSYARHIGGSADNPEGTWAGPPTNPVPYNKNVLPFAVGKYSFANQDAQQWAAWGIDYLKYDWNPIDIPTVQEMASALRAAGGNVVFSLSNEADFDKAGDYARLANCWRTTGDIRDTWESVSSIGFSQDKWASFAGPGHWNDPDMLVVGYVGWGPNLHPSRLTPDEQYTHISLWCLLSAPLLLGCDLERLDPFTLNLLTNDDVLAVDQDALGKQATRVANQGDLDVYAKPLEDGSWAVGLFNRGPNNSTITVKWSVSGACRHTDRV